MAGRSVQRASREASFGPHGETALSSRGWCGGIRQLRHCQTGRLIPWLIDDGDGDGNDGDDPLHRIPYSYHATPLTYSTVPSHSAIGSPGLTVPCCT